MSFKKVFYFDNNFKVVDSEYRKMIEKSLRKLSKVLINDSFLGYESTVAHIENFNKLLQKHKQDFEKYHKPYYDKLEKIKKGFLLTEKGYTTKIEADILLMIDLVEKILAVENYKEHSKSKEILSGIDNQMAEFVLETNLVDRRTRKNYQKKIALIRELFERNTFISLVAISNELKELEKLKKENTISYQNLYLRNVNRYEVIKDEYERVKSYFTTKEKEVIDLQCKDVEKLLNSESYNKFDNASDILDIIEEKFHSAISGKKERIVKYLKTEVDGYVGYLWTDDLQQIREGLDFIISEAEKTNDFNNLNLDKFKIDEKVNSKKAAIDEFVRHLVSSSSDARRDQKAKISKTIKNAESFYRRDVSKKDFEDFIKKTENVIQGKISKAEIIVEKSKKKMLILMIVFIIPSIFLMFYNKASTEEYNFSKGKKYLKYVTMLAKNYRNSGRRIDSEEIRKRIYAPSDDLKILIISDSTVTINYKGNVLKGKF